ncbi:hypothetical protein [Acinetobacter sp. Ac_5812]|uniref:hypothetical protein n=1 Tax=Acinetobacter sp. Ac_5812 TaxID=1848937 RepID=UPI001490343D|nr:hypothetical protein [Acinetobacter sp. Ac_5812]
MNKIKILFISFFLSLLSISTITSADSVIGNNGPKQWGPWYLIKSEPDTYWIKCTYKRNQIKPNGGAFLTETYSLVVPRYPSGRCSDTITL